jgi:hypothetical protein
MHAACKFDIWIRKLYGACVGCIWIHKISDIYELHIWISQCVVLMNYAPESTIYTVLLKSASLIHKIYRAYDFLLWIHKIYDAYELCIWIHNMYGFSEGYIWIHKSTYSHFYQLTSLAGFFVQADLFERYVTPSYQVHLVSKWNGGGIILIRGKTVLIMTVIRNSFFWPCIFNVGNVIKSRPTRCDK